MSSFALALLLLGLPLLLALSWWLRGRVQRSRAPDSEAKLRFAAERFDTTLGELRDLREALRPIQSAGQKDPARSPRAR